MNRTLKPPLEKNKLEYSITELYVYFANVNFST